MKEIIILFKFIKLNLGVNIIMMLEMIDKNKIRADDYISVLMVISYLLFALFFRMEALISIILYPFASLAIMGVLKIINGFNKNKHDNSGNFNKVLLGIIYIIIGILFLEFIIIQPNVTSDILISLIAFPMMIVGIAGIIKGTIIDIYSEKFRVINMIIGVATLIVSIFAFTATGENYMLHIATLSLTLLINIVSRAALYLSEYGLSLIHLKNFKIFFYIISDYLIYVDRNGNLVLSKME